MSSLNRTSAIPIIFGTFIIFFAGYFSASFVEAATTYKPDLSKFWEVSRVMQQHYPFKEKIPSKTKQIEGAIAGLVDSYGDPYTVYLSKSQLTSLKDSVKGSFSGIGVEVGMKDGLLTVISPIKDSPADKAGFLAGDIIYKVDDKDVSNMNIDEIIQMIRGPKGTPVTIEIVRKGAGKPIVLSPVRDTISIPTTKSETIDNIDIISLYTFTRESVEQIFTMLKGAQENNRSAVILDLRGNPGGLLDSATEIASMLLPKGSVIVRERPGQIDGKNEDIFKSEGYNVISKDMKVIVLLNEGSASASEILAGALQDHKRATVIGTQSFGKGSVQEIVDLSDDSGIKITVAKWYTPNNNSISEKGITPDISIADSNLLDTDDEVLKKAIEYARNGTAVATQ